ncbi:mannose-1-phosphate guanylyltransferase [Angustibacter sp. Root456]|nr:sugar phosphate nucleotidyltransferase [Angustibacter sp. Root456]KQX69998.1 mannose-1-phosphate guanylyltransferase [Angustibacter sp. Root456]
MIDDLVAIVPAGGAGTRLWPLSRRSRPKFLLDLTGSGRSMLQDTCSRLAGVAGQTYVVTGAAHAADTARQLPEIGAERLLVEPSPRDSAAAIGLAAAVAHARDPEAVVGSFAADHAIADDAVFAAVVAEAVAVARTGLLVTVGIEPTRPATGFGYVRAGDALEVAGAPSALMVEEFVEKPDTATAEQYLASGRYRWNAGMFVARAATLLDLLDEYRPELGAGLRRLGQAWDTADREAELEAVWPTLERIAFDYAVAEPAAAAGRVAVVPGTFGWDDVGDFGAVGTVLPDAPVQVLGEGEVLATDSSGVVAADSGRLVALLGVDDVVVVDTADVLLVAHRSRAQDVKSFVDRLAADGRTDLL